jgi:hypothetical protein
VLSPTSTVRGWEKLPIVTRPGSRATVQDGAKAATAEVPLEGTWNVTIKGPTGPMPTTLLLERVNGALAGSQSGQGSTSQISGAKFENGNIYWINQITKPMKMKLEFSGTVRGGQMSGKVKAGFMGSFPFTGVRA